MTKAKISTATRVDSQNKPLSKQCDTEGLRQQYTEVHNTVRLYSTLRFAIFTVYFAALAGLIYISFGFLESKTRCPNHVEMGGRIAALLLTYLFYCYEKRIQSLRRSSFEYGKKLEDKLGYDFIKSKMLSGDPLGISKLTINAFILLLLFWVTMVVWMFVEILIYNCRNN